MGSYCLFRFSKRYDSGNNIDAGNSFSNAGFDTSHTIQPGAAINRHFFFCKHPFIFGNNELIYSIVASLRDKLHAVKVFIRLIIYQH